MQWFDIVFSISVPHAYAFSGVSLETLFNVYKLFYTNVTFYGFNVFIQFELLFTSIANCFILDFGG